MGETSIPWCDYTLNEWIGCTKVSPGCTFCYAAERDKRHLIEKVDHWGKGAPRYRTSEATRNAPYRWNKRPWICDVCRTAIPNQSDPHFHTEGLFARCPKCNGICCFHRARVFLGSLMDIFDGEVPIQWFTDALFTVFECREIDFLLVTKRPENGLEHIAKALKFAWSTASQYMVPPGFMDWLDDWHEGNAPPNVWMITSAEDQKRLDERVPHLLKIPAAVHGLSCEPLLGQLDLTQFIQWRSSYGETAAVNQRWVIAGGESGPSARPMNVQWMEDIQKQCAAAGVGYFAKQLGSYCVTDNANLHEWHDRTELVGHGEGAAAARINFKLSKKGENMAEWPEELRVRQWPQSSPRTIMSGTGAPDFPIARASDAPSSTEAQ